MFKLNTRIARLLKHSIVITLTIKDKTIKYTVLTAKLWVTVVIFPPKTGSVKLLATLRERVRLYETEVGTDELK